MAWCLCRLERRECGLTRQNCHPDSLLGGVRVDLDALALLELWEPCELRSGLARGDEVRYAVMHWSAQIVDTQVGQSGLL